MEIFGWILFSLLAAFGFAILILFAIPFIATETTMMKEKIRRAVEDKKYDLDKRSEERRRRGEIKREKDFELANKKLDNKLLKVDKQIKLHEQKLKLAKELKMQTTTEKQDLIAKEPKKKILLEKQPQKHVKTQPIVVNEDEELAIPDDGENIGE